VRPTLVYSSVSEVVPSGRLPGADGVEPAIAGGVGRGRGGGGEEGAGDMPVPA
jgi:hypothetical protein